VKEITAYIMKTHNLEISGGLGPSVGLVREIYIKILCISLLFLLDYALQVTYVPCILNPGCYFVRCCVLD